MQIITTACVALAICALMGLLSLCRGFIEAAHDATGVWCLRSHKLAVEIKPEIAHDDLD
jgi:hypothetical protein